MYGEFSEPHYLFTITTKLSDNHLAKESFGSAYPLPQVQAGGISCQAIRLCFYASKSQESKEYSGDGIHGGGGVGVSRWGGHEYEPA